MLPPPVAPLLLLCLLSVVVYGFSPAARLLFVRPRSATTQLNADNSNNKNALDRELDTFLERAAESGAAAVRKMTPNERAMRAIRGSEIEDSIFAAREELLQLEDDVFSGKVGADAKAKLTELRSRMEALKIEYMDVVGANDLPLYFGKVADSHQ